MKVPSFDKLYCSVTRFDESYDPSFDPRDSVQEVLFSPVKKELGMTAIAAPWHAPNWYLKRLIQKENEASKSALCLRYDDRILSADAYKTLKCFDVVAERYHQEFLNIKSAPTDWLAVSLGTPVAIHTMSTTHLFTKRKRFITPGGDLAESLATGVRTQGLWKQYMAQGMTIDELKEIWKPLSPTEQAWRIGHSTIDLTISMADEVIRPETAFEFAAALEHDDNRVNLHVNAHLGHYGTLLKAAL